MIVSLNWICSMLMAANILSENPGIDAERVDSKRPQKLSLPEQHDPPLFFPPLWWCNS